MHGVILLLMLAFPVRQQSRTVVYNLKCTSAVCVVSHSVVPALCNPMDCSLCPWDVPGKKYWSGLPFPSPADLPGPGIEPVSPALQVNFLTA